MLTAIRSGRVLPRGLVLALFASALLLRMLVPAGWMPAAGGDLRIVICTGMGAAEAPPEALKAMAAYAGHKSPDHDGKSSPDHPCSFFGLALAMALAATPAPLEAPKPAQAFEPPALTVAIGRGLAAPPPPSTGPPAIA